MIKVAFICVHNSCRSQIAEAFGKLYASNVFESFSAGTCIDYGINNDAQRLMKKNYNIDLNESQFSKLISDIPTPDIVILMGCNVACPQISAKHIEDWGIEDPTAKDDASFIEVIEEIKNKVQNLAQRITKNQLFRT